VRLRYRARAKVDSAADSLFSRDDLYGNDRRGLDLYQDIVPEEFADLYERTCGRLLGIDKFIPHVADSLDLRNIGRKEAQFNDVVHSATRFFNNVFDIGKDLFGLFFEIVLTDKVALRIQCNLPGNNNHPAIAEIDYGRLGITMRSRNRRRVNKFYFSLREGRDRYQHSRKKDNRFHRSSYLKIKIHFFTHPSFVNGQQDDIFPEGWKDL
jgi:hypothetical protein